MGKPTLLILVANVGKNMQLLVLSCRKTGDSQNLHYLAIISLTIPPPKAD
jgi:hypothetical protein